jgi:hypothetical protein
LATLAGQKSTYDEAIALALHCAPTELRKLLRQGLHSSEKHHRETAAAVLGLIGRPWCWDELTEVLDGSTDWAETLEVRSVLGESTKTANRSYVNDWETREGNSRPDNQYSRVSLADVRGEWAECVTERRLCVLDL